MKHVARGTFEVKLRFEPLDDAKTGVSLSRAAGDKRFMGGLVGESHVEMLSARREERNAALYVALERIRGTLDGRQGSFVLWHRGLMTQEGQSLVVEVMPESGTDQLEGITGTMEIDIQNGQHFYKLHYDLPS